MGTTLHAIIEIFYHGDKKHDLVDMWETVGTWEFNKDYPLSMWLYDNAHEGWPHNSNCMKDEEYKYCDEGRQWCTVNQLDKAFQAMTDKFVKDPEDYWYPRRLLALAVACDNLADANPVRILWYRM